MDSKRFGPVLLTLALALAAPAGAVELADGAPDRYVVRRGDTLWDIAGRFLREPWRWPEIWQRNPQVRNPDRIYPGDELLLEYVDGRPVVRVAGRRGSTVKLSPQVRETVIERAIPTIPVDAIGPFMTESRVLATNELEQAPYILSAGREHLVGLPGDVVYARQVEDGDGAQRYGIYRQGDVYRSPESDEVLGYQATYVADAVLESPGDPATFQVTRATREVQPGDRVLPLEEDVLREPFVPRAPEGDVRGNIISVVDGVAQVGRYQVVVLDLGAADGLEAGHVLAVHQRGEVVVDRRVEKYPEPAPREDFPLSFDNDLDILLSRVANAFSGPPEVELPERRAGMVMVVRPFERVSYALVMEAMRPMHVTDIVSTP